MTNSRYFSNEKVRNAVIYIRVSTDKESQNGSYEVQYQELKNFSKQKGFEVLKVYKERVTATKMIGRDKFDELLEGAVQGKFDAILFKDLSRSARNIEMAARLKRICLENQIGIYSMTEGDHLELESLNYNFRAMMNEHYSIELSMKIKSRFRTKMENGEFINGEPPYGYIVKENKLYIRNDNTPDIVKRIFKKYIEGSGVDSIAKRLTNDKITTPSMLKRKANAGVVWHGSTIKKMLENKAYCGDLEQGKEETASAISKKRIKKEKTIIVENTHEPIITKELFLEVQNLMESRKSGPRSTPKRHLFTDILECGKCGKKYWYRSSGKRYICGAYARYGKVVCCANAVKEEIIKNIVVNDLNSIIKKYKINETIAEKVDTKINKKIYSMKNKKNILQEKIKRYEEAKAELIVSKISNEISSKEYDLAAKLIEKNIREIEEKINNLEKVNFEVDKMKVEKQIKEIFIGIDNFEQINREILFRFVEKIIVHGKDNYEIVYRFKL